MLVEIFIDVLIKEIRRIIREELLKEYDRTNAEVVLTFLKDRQVEPRMRKLGLDRLIDEPNLESELENHMRASALVGCKGEALDWLGLQLNQNPETSERRFDSLHSWQKHDAMDSDWFKIEALNCWGQPFYASAQEYRASRLQHPEAKNWFDQTDDIEIARAINEPSMTIWVPHENGLRCVEGNKRMHALALGMAKGIVPENGTKGWKMWVRK